MTTADIEQAWRSIAAKDARLHSDPEACGSGASPSDQILFKRLQRQLKHQHHHLHRCRENSRSFATLGRYYVTDDRRHVVAADVDLTKWLDIVK